MSEIKVEQICKSFGDNLVLDHMDFQVEDGSFLALLGPSGCGKTTMLRIISGLEFPDSGRILVSGQDLTAVPTEKRNVGMVFQNYALIPHMTVASNIAYGLKIRHIPKEEIRKRVGDMIDLVGLAGMENRKVTKLSGGQQQRVALARALVIQPQILLLDEPMAALDRKIRAEMQYEIRRIQREVGITTVFVTHDQEEAMTMSDHIILMNRGGIEQFSTPEHMYNHPVSLFTSDFLGKANILRGRVRREEGNWFVAGEAWRFPIRKDDALADGDTVSVVIRGEQFQLSRTPVPGATLLTIANKVFTGVVCKLTCSAGEDLIDVVCINTVASDLRPGDSIYVSVDPEWVHCFPLGKEGAV